MRHLIFILGDQLSHGISSLAGGDPRQDGILMVEAQQEATYVLHHQKKIALVLSAMRHFAQELSEREWRVDYRALDAPENTGNFTDELIAAVRLHKPAAVIITAPGEWRVLQMIRQWPAQLPIAVQVREDTRFVCSTTEFADWARDRKQLRMEYFYRDMRRKTGLLMKGDQPEGGKWNFDAENRKPARPGLFMPEVPRFAPDLTTREVLRLVEQRFSAHFGRLQPFGFAVRRSDALTALAAFVEHALPSFGDFQDAMLNNHPFLYHAVISAYLNCGLLEPLEACRAVEDAWRAGRVPLNAAEGFIRQIIGWREYVRGIYWLKMPEYATSNYFNATRPVPASYWGGKTDMACVRAAVSQTRDEAYAHHIQRLMVTGNFALLAGINPQALHEWYLSVYADAYEWVEMPNTLGMSQFADGGLLASKPYVASGAYINRMSDYCQSCHFDVKQRTGGQACPFNPLYWNFIARHRDTLASNPRMAPMYRVYDKFDADEKRRITDTAQTILAGLD
jgi:deoxyribodipyrimidine photolyase-related protein